ncbi:hypothetical protein HHK36_005559 [Tetracentron sinense]|uniref:Uncharacterized protein n=1 Tax=Tetracentron sinense TaxID=13715 RepID=A0A835DMF0_TETSI|nr:hypothetical protein HHK36_005559 [Tetracentron sinense]
MDSTTSPTGVGGRGIGGGAGAVASIWPLEAFFGCPAIELSSILGFEDLGVKSLLQKRKTVPIVSLEDLIASAGAIGVCLPILGKKIPALRPEKDIFFVIKVFATGVILATGFIHVLPDAFDNLTLPCISENPWVNFLFTGFVAMMSSIGTLMVDSFATGYYLRSHYNKTQTINGDEEMNGQLNRRRLASRRKHHHQRFSSVLHRVPHRKQQPDFTAATRARFSGEIPPLRTSPSPASPSPAIVPSGELYQSGRSRLQYIEITSDHLFRLSSPFLIHVRLFVCLSLASSSSTFTKLSFPDLEKN